MNANLANLLHAVMTQLAHRAAGTEFSGEELDDLIVDEGPKIVQSVLPDAESVVGRTGMGTQSDVPWIGVFPPGAAVSAKTGCYVVYLFAKDGSQLYLSLNQGTENIRGGKPPLLKRALDMRTIIGDRADESLKISLDLRSTAGRPQRYAAGSALARKYGVADQLDGAQLSRDLLQFYDYLQIVVRAGLQLHPEVEPTHLLFKWNADHEPATIDIHRRIAESEGSVWWGRFAGPDTANISAAKIADLEAQLSRGFQTYAFLSRRETVWRTSVVEATTDRSRVVGDQRFPDYYTPDECNFFVRIKDFQHLPAGWATDHIVLASDPDPLKITGALSNQTTPLYVFERFDPAHLPVQAPEVSETDIDFSLPEPTSQPTVWIFQTDPREYDLLGYLELPSTQPGSVGFLPVGHHANMLNDGDTVLLWVGGDAAGIYATGTILGSNFRPDRRTRDEMSFFAEGSAIHFRLEHLLLTQPVLRQDLLEHPILKHLPILRDASGTNHPLSGEQWEALRPLLEPLRNIPPEASPPDPSIDLDWLLRVTLWTEDQVNEVIDTLRFRRPQVILSGPPGTSKTWVAERIGQYLAGGRLDATHVVQFHPTYAYEDFVEGLRPVEHHGSVAFKVVPGRLVDVAEHARRVDHPVVLVIDEMNRANIPSVFGELLYLLEYRDKTIGLLHRQGFSLPPNLYIIATMNTADRSIRTVDTALRRRFDIFDCPPRPDILDRYYSTGNRADVPGLSAGLQQLNDLLTEQLDRHHTVGHSFLMDRHFGYEDLERTWKRQIRPLIDEYFFDQPDLADEFQLESFWPRLTSQ